MHRNTLIIISFLTFLMAVVSGHEVLGQSRKKQKKITKLEDSEKNSSDSDTFEYTEKDIQEFEKLMHKK